MARGAEGTTLEVGPWMWEPLACPERSGIWRKPLAKCRPDEQEAYARRLHSGEGATKPDAVGTSNEIGITGKSKFMRLIDCHQWTDG